MPTPTPPPLPDAFRRRFLLAASASIAAEESMQAFLTAGLPAGRQSQARFTATAAAVRDLILEARRSFPGVDAIRCRGRIWTLATLPAASGGQGGGGAGGKGGVGGKGGDLVLLSIKEARVAEAGEEPREPAGETEGDPEAGG